MNKGKIVQVIGPVVDVEFPEDLPGIYNALTVDVALETVAFIAAHLTRNTNLRARPLLRLDVGILCFRGESRLLSGS